MLKSNEAYEKVKQRKPKIDKKDTKYALKYIDKKIKKASKQGRTHIILNNIILKENPLFFEAHYCYIDKLPKVMDALYANGYDVERFRTDIKISWEKKGI